MNAIEEKFSDLYYEFRKANNSSKCFFHALVIDREDDNKVTDHWFSIGYTYPGNDDKENKLPRLTEDQDNAVFFSFADIAEAISCISQLDFTPDEDVYDNAEAMDQYHNEVLSYMETDEDRDYYFNSPCFFSILDILDFSKEPD